MIRRTFTGYKPSIRTDGLPWTLALIREAPSFAGPWTVIDTIALIPLDGDPRNPIAREVFTDNATRVDGWYDVVFVDANGVEDQPTTPISAYAASGFTAGMVRATAKSVNFTTLGYPIAEDGGDPLDELVVEAVAYLEEVTGRAPLPGVPANLWPLAKRAIALRVVQLAYGFTGDNLSAAASGVESFSVPGYSETRSSGKSGVKGTITNDWGALWDLIWLLMTAEKREEWLAAQREEDVPFIEIVDIDVPGAGLSDPEYGIW